MERGAEARIHTLRAAAGDPGPCGMAETSERYRFAAAATLALRRRLRRSNFRGTAEFDVARDLAAGARGPDPHGDRAGFLALVGRAADIPAQTREED